MKHLNHEQLVEYHYAEARGEDVRAAVAEHVASCDVCRASLEALERVLTLVEALPAPERDPAYGQRVWQKLAPRLEEPRSFDWTEWLAPRRWLPVAATAALVLAAFLAGRFWPRPGSSPTAAGPIPVEVRERILLVAVGDHLERSQMVLLELVHADAQGGAASGGVDVSNQQERAHELVAANRLYRQTAERSGDAAMETLLDELERVLLEIANSPAQPSRVQFEQLRRRIEAQGILFKVRVIGSELREREKNVAQAPAQGRS